MTRVEWAVAFGMGLRRFVEWRLGQKGYTSDNPVPRRVLQDISNEWSRAKLKVDALKREGLGARMRASGPYLARIEK